MRLASIEETRALGAGFIASGNWSSPDGIRVDIATVFVPTDKPDRAAVAVGTSPEFQMYLPWAEAYENDDEEEDDSYRHRDNAPCKEWIARRDGYAKLDEYDLFGSVAAIRRDRLTMSVNKAHSLTSSDPWSAAWHDPNGQTVYTAEAWGVNRGEGRHARADQGNTITCRTDFVLDLLKKSGCDLLMLVKLELFIERNRFSDDEDKSGFVYSWVTAIIDQTGNVRLVEPSDADREIVAGLSHEDKYSFNRRFAALTKDKER